MINIPNVISDIKRALDSLPSSDDEKINTNYGGLLAFNRLSVTDFPLLSAESEEILKLLDARLHSLKDLVEILEYEVRVVSKFSRIDLVLVYSRRAMPMMLWKGSGKSFAMWDQR